MRGWEHITLSQARLRRIRQRTLAIPESNPLAWFDEPDPAVAAFAEELERLWQEADGSSSTGAAG